MLSVNLARVRPNPDKPSRSTGIDKSAVNDLISRHNRWYPVESRLPMDPRTGDYARINGEDFRREPLGVEWALNRFPPRPPRVVAA